MRQHETVRSRIRILVALAAALAVSTITFSLTGCGDHSTAQASNGTPPDAKHGAAFRQPAADAAPAAEVATTISPDNSAREVAASDPRFAAGTPGGGTAAPPNLGGRDEKAPVGAPDKAKPEYLRVSFNELASFDYDAFDADVLQAKSASGGKAPASVQAEGEKSAERGPNWQIPERIMAVGGKQVVVQGFMVPIEIRKDEVKSFLLVRNQMVCCQGVMVGYNEWIFVQMEGERRAKFVPDTLVSVFGKLDVGEDIQNGMVMSIYRLEGRETVFKSGY